MSKKIGRNDDCPCGSGLKYKRCCGASSPSPRQTPPVSPLKRIPPEVISAYLEQEQKERERIKTFGQGRPIISSDFADHKFVAVGSKLHYAKDWKTFHDFLVDYIKGVLDGEWGKAELQKPFEERHPALQWYHQVCEFQRRMIEEPGQVYSAIATGPVMAYNALAYDLYTLAHHSLLHQKLVKRLKVKDQFQGARYETYVAAAFVRAGFDVILEDESNTAETHCEFVAVHMQTGLRYSIEAKSRHRHGYLGQPGQQQPLEEIEGDVYRLLQKALSKKADHERIIFIDVNVPPHTGNLFEAEWLQKVAEQLKRLEDTQSPENPWPAGFVFFTNHPYHYVGSDAPEPGRTTIFTTVNMGDFKQPNAHQMLRNYPAIDQLLDSVLNHTKIPHEF